MKKKLIFIHPFLFAFYPLVFLYAENINEYLEEILIFPSFLVVIFAAAVLFITKIFVKKIEKAAIISSAFVLVFFSYSRLLEAINKIYVSESSVLFAWIIDAVFLALVVYLVLRSKKYLLPINKILTFLSLFLVLFSVITIISFEMQTKRIFTPRQSPPDPQAIENSVTDKNAPDIYYFIFDRYAGPRSLKEQYNFDNSKFLNFLEKKRFYLAENAKTNYPKTFLSLGSSLNMEYLGYLSEKTNGGASPDELIVTPLIRNGKVLQFLKGKGYYIVNIGPKTWTPTSENPYADKNFIMEKGTYPYADIFTTGFLNTTIAAPIFARVFHNPIDVSQNPDINEHRRQALYELQAVEKSVSLKGPKFVFAHILLPHDPFVFDKECQPVPETVTDQKDHVTNYLAQLECANTKMTQLISDILQKSKTPPVIILQSDEGPYPMISPISIDQSWGTADDIALREKFPILNAYYFPNASTDALYSTITPVNSFRVLFNTYFGANYDLLPDRNYIFQDEKNYYKFIDVTQRVK